MKRLGSRLLDLLYPPKCVFCRKLLQKDEDRICNACRLHLPLSEEIKDTGPYLSDCVAALSYEGVVRDSLLRYKFEGMEQYAACFADLMRAAVSSKVGKNAFDLVTWVPVSRRRLRRRGYDQAELLAQKLAVGMQKPVKRLLRKNRNTPAQSTMTSGAARRANVLGVYCAVDPEAIAGKSILLVDDIFTTGATMSEAARVLLTAGAGSVHGAVMAAKGQKN